MTPPESGMEPEQQPQEPTVIDQIADLLDMTSKWLRQEVSDIVRKKVVLPLQQLGLTLASAQAAGCLMIIGLFWLEVGLIVMMGVWMHSFGLDWAAAYGVTFIIMGVVASIGSAVFIAIKTRWKQK